jgi:hypothetical protein
MAQLAQPVEPFGEVNVHRLADDTLEIVATILMEPDIEGARTGLALDASASMKKMYGATAPVSPLFKSAAGGNVVEPVARTMASYLARFATDGRVRLLYWACSPDGSQIEPIGEFNDEQIQRLAIPGPKKLPWGRGTKLLPPLRHFIDEAFRDAPWAIVVFVTDGIIEDLDAVKQFSRKFAEQIATGRRAFIKLVLLGIGEEVDERQMEELDDMFEGSELRDPRGQSIDLWDHKLAKEMRQLSEIFAEVVSADMTIADWGRIRDERGRLAAQFPDGLPALLRFRLPSGSRSFSLEFPGGTIVQELGDALDRLG